MIEASHQTLESYSPDKIYNAFYSIFKDCNSRIAIFYYNYINIDKINVQIQININKATLYFNVILSNSDSLPTCFTAAVAIAIDCGDISFAATPPTVFAQQVTVHLYQFVGQLKLELVRIMSCYLQQNQS